MRRLLMALLLLLAMPAGARDFFNEPVFNDRGDPVLTGCRALVYNYGTTTLATVYTVAGAVITQPITQDSGGYIVFTADDGLYRIQLYGAGVTPRSLFRAFFDPTDGIDAPYGDLDWLELDVQAGAPAGSVAEGKLWYSTDEELYFRSGNHASGKVVRWLDRVEGSGRRVISVPFSAINPTAPELGDTYFGAEGLKTWDGDSWVYGSGLASVNDDPAPQLGGDLDVNGNAIVSVSNGDIEITPNGTGSVVLDGLDWPQADGTDGQVLTTNAAGTLSWGDPAVGGEGGILNVVEDLTPQLGGMLDVNAQAIGDGTRELLTFVEDGAAVNNVEIENASTGTSPTVRAVGDDADVPLVLEAKGAGAVVSNGSFTVIGDIGVTGTVDGVDVSARDHASVTLAGTPDYITISGQQITRGQIDLSADVVGALPIDSLDITGTPDGTQFLRDDGAWAAPAGSGDVTGPASAVNGELAVFDGTTGKAIEGGSEIGAAGGDLTGVDTIANVSVLTVNTTAGLTIYDAGADDVTVYMVDSHGTGEMHLDVEGNIDAGGLVDGASLDPTGITDGYVLTADGVNGAGWEAPTGGGDALVANPLSQFAATTSAQLAGVISDETGSGLLVFGTSPVLTTPNLGTPSAGTLSSCTGYPGGAVTATGITDGYVLTANTNMGVWAAAAGGAPEGTAVLSTGETGGTKYLREDGDGTCSWQTPAGSGDVTGPVSSTDNAIATWSGTGGDVLQNTALTYTAGTLSGASSIACVQELYCDGAGTGFTVWENYATAVDFTLSNTGAGVMDLRVDGSVHCDTLYANVIPGGGGGISNVIEDLTPQLGGNLDLNSYDFTEDDGGNVSFTTTAATGTSLTLSNSGAGVMNLVLDGTITAMGSPGLVHEFGGLEANVSAYNGLVKISSGTTSAVTVTTFAESLLDDADAATARATLGVSDPTLSKGVTVEDPTSAEDISLFFTPVAITVTEMRAVLVGSATPSVTWTVRHQPAATGSGRADTGNEVVTGGTATTSTTEGSDVTSFNDATIPADSFVWLETTAQSGTVTEINITIVYTED